MNRPIPFFYNPSLCCPGTGGVALFVEETLPAGLEATLARSGGGAVASAEIIPVRRRSVARRPIREEAREAIITKEKADAI